jgi:hypothetical protein
MERSFVYLVSTHKLNIMKKIIIISSAFYSITAKFFIIKNYTIAMTFILLCIALASRAQKTTWGIQGGVTYATMTLETGNRSFSFDRKPGFTLGIMVDKSLGKTFFFQPSINFVQKGYRETLVDDDRYKVTLNYLELPMNFVYSPNKESGFFIGGGPSLGLGLGGKFKTGGYEHDMVFGGEGNFDLFEFEGNLITGYKFPNKLQVSLNYNFGLTNVELYKNNYFGLRLGYFFK